MPPYLRVALGKSLTYAPTRKLHLVHEMYTKGTPSHKLAHITEKTLPDPGTRFPITDIWGATLGEKTMSEALELLRPALHLRQIVLADKRSVYRIEKLKPPPVKPNPEGKPKRAGEAKSLYLTTACGERDLKHKLSKAYEFLCRGWKVELHLRPRGGVDSWKSVDWALLNCIHLRPEVIFASMPKGTTMLVDPVSEGVQLIWVMYLPKEWRKMLSAPNANPDVQNTLLDDSSYNAEEMTPT